MRTVTAMFDNRADAESARERLAAAGISQDQVSIHDQNSLARSNAAPGGSTGSGSDLLDRRDRDGDGDRETGLWQSIKDFFSGDEHVYEEGMRRGGYLLTARVEDDRADAAIDILDDDGTVDLEERSNAWRSDGWDSEANGATGAGMGAAGIGAASAVGQTPVADRDRSRAGAAPAGAASEIRGIDQRGVDQRSVDQRGIDQRSVDQRGDSEGRTIPIVEEQLRVGKRETERGGVRVRSYVVETPVHEEIRLREERVDVERRPVSGDGKVTAGDVTSMLREQTVEVRETSEEAVIDKNAIVREEVAITKSVGERVERIDDSVRRTEVEIERLGDKAGDGISDNSRREGGTGGLGGLGAGNRDGNR